MEGGAEVGGIAEELEWPHGWWTVYYHECVNSVAMLVLGLFMAAALR